METILADDQFRTLLDTYMVTDIAYCGSLNPTQKVLYEEFSCGVEDLLDYESNTRGYDNWVVAYHEFVA